MKPEIINQLKADCKKALSTYEPSLEILRHQVILVAGGTGFMGKWLAEAVSLLNTEYDFNIKLYLLARNVQEFKEEVPHLAKQPFIHLLEQDVRNIISLPEDVEWIINAAGTPDNRKHSINPLKTMDVFYKGTHALLDACLRLQNLKKFVQISSATVYGQQSVPAEQISETQMGVSDPNTALAVYSESKRIAETICAIYKNQQKLPIVIVRPFSFIGPYQELEKPWAINNFIRDAILGGPIRILGNENTVRSYLYGSDVAFWLLVALAKGKSGSVYNIGGDQPISLKTLSEKIIANFPNKIDVLVRYSKQYPAHPSVSVPNTALIKKDLGVKQTVDFEKALQKTIDWYKVSAS